MTSPALDLLQERRKALGRESMASVLAERTPLVRRGVLIGGTVLGAVLGITGVLFLRHAFVRAQNGELVQYEGQATALTRQISSRKGRLEQLRGTNRKLAESLTAVRSSSALLTELQLRTPDGVQLLAAEAKGAKLVLKGRAQDPMAFARINALELELKRSPLLEPGGVTLSKVERQSRKDANPLPGTVPRGSEATAASFEQDGPEAVSFEMSGPFLALAPARQLELLRRLGSDGMAKRLEMLRKEGLVP